MTAAKRAVPAKGTTITDSHFYGVHWDATAVSAIQTVANGLVKNAEALKTLAELFKSQNIHIEALLKVVT